MRLLNDIYKNNFGTLEVEPEKDSILNTTKFAIKYSLEFDDNPSDSIIEEIEKQDSLINVLKCLDEIELVENSFNSIILGYIEEEDEMYNLVLTIDSFMNIYQDYEDISDVGVEYTDVFPEIEEMLKNNLG